MIAWLRGCLVRVQTWNAQQVERGHDKQRTQGFCYAMDGLCTGAVSERTLQNMIDAKNHHPVFLEGLAEGLEYWLQFEDEFT